MWYYIKYLSKMLTGLLVITALNIMLKKADPYIGDFWFYTTLITYNCYCYFEYRLEDKDSD